MHNFEKNYYKILIEKHKNLSAEAEQKGGLHPEDEPHKEFRIAELNGKLNELLIKEKTEELDPDEESLKKQIIESLGNNRRGGGRRRSKKRPTARRRRSSKRKARKSRITRRR